MNSFLISSISFTRLSKTILRLSSSSNFRANKSQLLMETEVGYGPPPLPSTFNKGFSILTNPKETYILENTNPHPLDTHISFNEEAHIYKFDGMEIDTSVTKLVEQYFDKFEAEKVANKMISGPKWPREGYTFRDGTPYPIEKILQKWEEQGEYARNRGTWMHHNIERFINNLEPSYEQSEVKEFERFYKDIIVARGIIDYRTEWRIAAPDLKLAGSVDYVGKLPDGTFILMDWKRSKRLPTSLSNSFGRRG
eukprot:gene7620-10374_t